MDQVYATPLSWGHYIPPDAITLDDRIAMFGEDTMRGYTPEEGNSVKGKFDTTGVYQTPILDHNVPHGYMGAHAVENALYKAEIIDEEGKLTTDKGKKPIDMILWQTNTPENNYPGLARRLVEQLSPDLQNYLVKNNIPIIPGGMACPSFIQLMSMANAYIRSGQAKRIVVATEEQFSEYVDWTDANTASVLSDLGAATYIGATREPGITSTYLGTFLEVEEIVSVLEDRKKDPTINDWKGKGPIPQKVLETNAVKEIFGENYEKGLQTGEWIIRADHTKLPHIVGMLGKPVFVFAINALARVAYQTIINDPTISDEEKTSIVLRGDNDIRVKGLEGFIDKFIPHQASWKVINSGIKKAGIKPEQTIYTIDFTGNGGATAAAVATSLAIDNEIVTRRKNYFPKESWATHIEPSDTILLGVFGGGLHEAGIKINMKGKQSTISL